jgi:hypothetical protein
MQPTPLRWRFAARLMLAVRPTGGRLITIRPERPEDAPRVRQVNELAWIPMARFRPNRTGDMNNDNNTRRVLVFDLTPRTAELTG